MFAILLPLLVMMHPAYLQVTPLTVKAVGAPFVPL
jgi:hypothetical protein